MPRSRPQDAIDDPAFQHWRQHRRNQTMLRGLLDADADAPLPGAPPPSLLVMERPFLISAGIITVAIIVLALISS